MENKNVIRFEFKKKGGLKYISHLDLQRALTRIIKRSKIPVRFTQGFNPHAKMVFALPLGVGCESECELLDVYMVMDEARPNVPLYTPEEFKEAIVPNLPKGLDFVSANYPERPFLDIKSARYEIELEIKDIDSILPQIEEAFSKPMIVFKKSKAGDKNVDILPMVLSHEIEKTEEGARLSLTLIAEQNHYLSPELVMTALKSNEKIKEHLLYYTVTRTSIQFATA